MAYYSIFPEKDSTIYSNPDRDTLNTGIDEIWLVISPKSPHKIYQNILDKNLR